MRLTEPSPRYIESYKAALTEFERAGITGFWSAFEPIDDAQSCVEHIKRYDHRTEVDGNAVPASVYWLVEGPEFIGHVSIRHTLSPALERLGGHIGYAIRPSKQGQGYGSRMLELALDKAKKLGIERVLVTCGRDNVASRKVIERNGGKLVDEDEVNGKPVLRFRIDLA